MRGLHVLVLFALASGALAGCLGSPAQEPEPTPTRLPPSQPPPTPAPTPTPTPTPTPSPSPSPTPSPTPTPPPPDAGPQAVIAHIDTGINPYHAAFRDPSPLGQRHPCTYLPRFPCDAQALPITLTVGSMAEAMERDAALWAGVQANRLYWFPGTKIVGAISLGPGGVLCPQPLVTVPSAVPPVPPVAQHAVECPERVLFDDHGHGTMTASRMAATTHSLCPACRIVSIEGLGAAGVRWAADQGWIDVQSNSWGARLPGVVPAVPTVSGGTQAIREAFAYAAQRMLVFAASGNGLQFEGFAGEPTLAQATMAAGVITVGAHDNGRAVLWHGQPPLVVADGYGGWRANASELLDFNPGREACCTSAASPYAAGGAAGMLLEARRMTGHRSTGFPQGIGAAGPVSAAGGPFADGNLTLAELHRLVLATARPRPIEGADDGLVQCFARGAECDPDPMDPGGNPYCRGCWSTPLRWTELPPEGRYTTLVGYGGIDPGTLAQAVSVLRGEVAAPDRAAEDGFFAADQAARAALDQLPP